MKTCPNCGCTLADEVTLCNSCGAMQMNSVPIPVVEPRTEGQPKPISIGGWMLRDLIPCIPIVGGIIYFVKLWIWSFDKSKEATFRNWAKSRLIWMAISGGVGLFFLILMLGLGVTLGDLFSEIKYY